MGLLERGLDGADRLGDHPGPQRLGRNVFPELFERCCGPVAGPAGRAAEVGALGTARGSFLRRWRLLGIHGFEIDVPDTKENAAEFGYAGSGTTARRSPRPGWWRWPSAAPTPSWPPRSTPTVSGRRPWRPGCCPGCASMSCSPHRATLRLVRCGRVPRPELVLGDAGPALAARRTAPAQPATKAEFAAFAAPGYVKIVLAVRAVSQGSAAAVLAVETRVAATDAASARRFRRYWRFVGPFSELIRCTALGMLARELDPAARNGGEIVIARPAETVFDAVADERTEPRYNPQVARSCSPPSRGCRHAIPGRSRHGGPPGTDDDRVHGLRPAEPVRLHHPHGGNGHRLHAHLRAGRGGTCMTGLFD